MEGRAHSCFCFHYTSDGLTHRAQVSLRSLSHNLWCLTKKAVTRRQYMSKISLVDDWEGITV